jgi:predicted small metal-binding protein
MGKLINCQCGQVVRGETDDELVANAEAHIRRDHPELVGRISRDDLLGMAESAARYQAASWRGNE